MSGNLVAAWAEHIWCRMRRMDYWTSTASVTNMPARAYRFVSPGSQPQPNIVKKAPETLLNIRYFDRDVKRRDVTAHAPAIT